MKLTTNTYKRLLWITASASLLGIAGCSNLPRTASSNSAATANTANYITNGVLNEEAYRDGLDSVIGWSPTAYEALDDPHPLPRGAGNGP
jgi:hypothetical protein